MRASGETYPAAISFGMLFDRSWRIQQAARIKVPMVTCSPWNPVVRKKMDP